MLMTLVDPLGGMLPARLNAVGNHSRLRCQGMSLAMILRDFHGQWRNTTRECDAGETSVD